MSCKQPTITSTSKVVKTLLTSYVLAATLFTLASQPKTLYTYTSTPFYVPPVAPTHISPLTTDIDEVLLDDSELFYLTWE